MQEHSKNLRPAAAPNHSPESKGLILLAEALEPVSKNLADLRHALPEMVPLNSESSRQISDHVFSGGGKLIRPAMFFLSARMAGYNGEHLVPIGGVCEYVHTASLLHDDVVDHSELRRSKPTANKLWGDQAAVLVGDLIYSRASELMAETGEIDLVRTFARSIRLMSEGELIQLENVLNLDFAFDDYIRLLTYKTGVLIGACCRAGAILGGLPEAQRDALEQFGQRIGIAFQLIDDALDYLGQREIFGKPTLSDLLEGKVTLPVLLLKETANASDVAEIRDCLERDPIRHEDVQTIAAHVDKYGTAQKSLEIARDYTRGALEYLHTHFEASPNRTNLENLAKSLLSRIH